MSYQIVDGAGNPTTSSRVEITGDAASGYHIALKAGVTLDSSNPQGRNFSFNIMATDQGGAHSAVQTISFTGSTGSGTPAAVKVGGAAALTVTELGVAGRDIGLLSAVDPDGVSALAYTVVDQNGNTLSNSPFEVVAGDAAGSFKLKLKNGVMLNREAYSNGGFVLYLRVTDAGGHTTFEPITVTVGNVVEAPTAVTMFGGTSFAFVENDAGLVIVNLATVGGDIGTYIYTLLPTAAEGNTNPDAAALAQLFEIDGTNIRKIASLDREAYHNGTFTFIIRAEIPGIAGTAFDQVITIDVTDENEAPTALTITGGTVADDADIGDVVASFGTTDPDFNDSHAYMIVANLAGDPLPGGHAFFAIGTGADADKIILKASLAGATAADLQLFIRTTDAGGLSRVEPLTVTVTEANAAPTAVLVAIGTDAPTTFIAIAENGTAGRDIGILSTTDADAGQTHTYRLVDAHGDPHAHFSFEIVETAEGSGIFMLKLGNGVTLNREDHNGGIYGIRIEVTDSGDPAKSFIQDIGIDITNVVEAPTSVLVAGETTLALTENATPIADFGGIAVDGGDQGFYTFSLISTAGEGNTNPDAAALAQLFAISNGTNLRQTAFLNHEDYANGTFTFKIRAELAGVPGTAFDQVITVNVANENEAPTAIDFGTAGGVTATLVKTASTDSPIGTLRTLDPDAGDTYSYTIVIGNNDSTEVAAGGPFKIGAGGKLLVDNAAALAALAGTQTTLWIRATDAGNLSTWQEFTINLTDNVAPTDIVVTRGTVTENAGIGAEAATLATTDQAGDTHHTYALVADEFGDPLPVGGHALFEIRTGDNKILLKAGLSDADVGSYDLWVRTTDDGGLSYIEKVTITVANVEETPAELRFSAAPVAELAAQGTVVGSLTTIDPDPSGGYTYALLDDAGGRFAIQGDRVVVQNGFRLDYEQAASHAIKVRVTDSSGLKSRQDLHYRGQGCEPRDNVGIGGCGSVRRRRWRGPAWRRCWRRLPQRSGGN